MDGRYGPEEDALRQRIIRALEEIAFSPEGEGKASERMKAMEMLGKLCGLWKEPETAGALEGERSKLQELLEQRRARQEGPCS